MSIAGAREHLRNAANILRTLQLDTLPEDSAYGVIDEARLAVSEARLAVWEARQQLTGPLASHVPEDRLTTEERKRARATVGP